MRLSLTLITALLVAPLAALHAADKPAPPADPLALNFHLMHPGGDSKPGEATKRIAELVGDAFEIRITIDRKQAERKRFGFRLFVGKSRKGLPIYFQPNNNTLRVGGTEAPFAVADLPAGEDVEMRIFIDKYLVEVFVNGRQAMLAADMDWQGACGLDAYTFGAPTTIKKVEIWKVKPTNQGYLEARENHIWEPDTK